LNDRKPLSKSCKNQIKIRIYSFEMICYVASCIRTYSPSHKGRRGNWHPPRSDSEVVLCQVPNQTFCPNLNPFLYPNPSISLNSAIKPTSYQHRMKNQIIRFASLDEVSYLFFCCE
jgi:hypothetical protein